MSGNLIIMHGGGPTAVINASLYGVLSEAKKHVEIEKVYVAIGGTGGFLNESMRDVTNLSEEKLIGLLQSPASAIGTSRDAIEEPEYLAMLALFEKYNIKYVLMNGGNGTMDTCGKLYQYCTKRGNNVKVIGIPKTMDNDLAITDHAPGFGSAARYMAGSIAEICCDVASLPLHIVVVEALGRNAGWVTAAAALAEDSYGTGPDLIYLPEVAFDEAAFLADVKNLIDTKGYGVVVASEGLHYADGTPIVKPVFKTERATYFGDVSSHLANLIIQKLNYKARSEKPGLLGRASIAWQSDTDRKEAVLCGKVALCEILKGNSGKMVALQRSEGDRYEIEPVLVDIEQVMMTEKTLPTEYINAAGNGVTKAFQDWARPLLGEPLPRLMDLRDDIS